ncbi:RNA polymerase sigma factor [Roseivirga sp.]|uniref:RNA polymerase sigma factor n=1 Tax=Roseivirga sp. TaxID=1964215 RepID=UPI003B523CC7
MTGRALISALQQKSEQAFRELVENFQDKVYNTCLGMLRDTAEAEECAQDVFIEVYRSIDGFREEAKLSTWIYRIATTKSLERIRKRKAKRRFAFLSSLSEDGKSEVKQVSNFVHPGLQMEQNENAKALFHALEQLSENQRVAFTLHKLEGLPYEEIAAVLELSLSSVESLMFRAKQNLKKLLKNYYEKNMVD